MLRRFLPFLFLALLVLTPAAQAAELPGDSAFVATALYIDAGDRDIPGLDLLNKGLNQVLRMQMSSLLLGSEVYVGTDVLRDLNRHGITNAASAQSANLTSYCVDRQVKNVILFTVNPLDMVVDCKAFTAKDEQFVVDKRMTPPEGGLMSTSYDRLAALFTNELPAIVATLKG